MRTMIYFVLVPTKQLRDLAGKFGFEDLIGNEVWHTYRHDPSGLEHSLEEFEDAAWTSFVGSFDLSQGAEREAAEQFLAECVELGFRACWEVHQAGAGDNVEQLLEKAKCTKGMRVRTSCACRGRSDFPTPGMRLRLQPLAETSRG